MTTHIHQDERGSYRTYSFKTEKKQMTTTDPGQQIVEMTKAYQHDHPTIGWSAAFEAIRASPEGKEVLRQYGMIRHKVDEDVDDPSEAPSEIDYHAKVEMKRNKALTYSDAVKMVMAKDPSWARAYSRHGHGR